MLTVEMKINGNLISYMYIVNVTDRVCPRPPPHMGPRDERQDVYEVELYRVGEGKVMRTTVQHARGDGAEVLVRKAISALDKCSGFKTT